MTKDNQNYVDTENALKYLKPSFQKKQCILKKHTGVFFNHLKRS